MLTNNYDRNLRIYPENPKNIPLDYVIPLPDSSSKIKDVADDGWESIDNENEQIREALKIMADYKDVDDEATPTTKTDDNSRTEDDEYDQIVYSSYTNDLDDQNDWGGIINQLKKHNQNEDDEKELRKIREEVFGPLKDKFMWIIPDIIAAGEHPIYNSSAQSLDFLREKGIGAIVSVCENRIESKYLNGFEYIYIPTIQGYSVELLNICKFIVDMEEQDKPVFVHSINGHGRAGTVIAAYFIYKGYLTADEAIAHVRNNYHKDAVETTEQENEIYRFAMSL